jgi:hypothetical protein
VQGWYLLHGGKQTGRLPRASGREGLVWSAGQQRESRGQFQWVIGSGHNNSGSGYNVEVRFGFNPGCGAGEIDGSFQFQDCQYDPSAGRRRR